MKKIIKYTIVGITLLVLSLGFGISLWISVPAAQTPEGAIIKHVIKKGHFIEALNLDIEKRDTIDEKYGQLFRVYGYTSLGSNVGFFYLKETNKGWHVESAGTGP